MKFMSKEKRVAEFLSMARVLEFLETANNKEEKLLEIKIAREEGLITEEEALDLAIEFC